MYVKGDSVESHCRFIEDTKAKKLRTLSLSPPPLLSLVIGRETFRLRLNAQYGVKHGVQTFLSLPLRVSEVREAGQSVNTGLFHARKDEAPELDKSQEFAASLGPRRIIIIAE
jgi:hypothetical protein